MVRAKQSDLWPNLLRSAKEADKAARTLHEAGRVRRVSVTDSESEHDESVVYPLDNGGSLVITWSHHEGHEPNSFQDDLYEQWNEYAALCAAPNSWSCGCNAAFP